MVIGANIRAHNNVIKIGKVLFTRGVRLGKKWWRTLLGREISCSQWEGLNIHSHSNCELTNSNLCYPPQASKHNALCRNYHCDTKNEPFKLTFTFKRKENEEPYKP